MTGGDDRFQRLLQWLSDDPIEAEQRFGDLSRRLTWYFRRHGFDLDAEDSSQLVLITVADKCAAPERPPYDTPEQLAFAIAKNFKRRRFSRPGPVHQSVESIEERPVRLERPQSADSNEMRCLELSLLRLSDDEQTMLRRYFASDEWERRELAAQLRLKSGTLRVKIVRLKDKLADMVDECLKTSTR
jgi:DNA-directed RNA polymerase specialized sigma24 family protein